MPRKRNLVILVSLPEHTGTMGTVADHVREMARDIAVHLVLDERRPWKRRLLALRPTLVFSPVYLHHRVGPKRAKVFQGAELNKSDEYKRLEAAGVPVPRWTLLREGEQPDLDGFGPIVVRKPDFGARGAYVEIMRREQVKWERMEDPVGPGKLDLIVQEFVYTGERTSRYRVSTLFGQPLYAIRVESAQEALISRAAFEEGASVIVRACDGMVTLIDDPDILAVARKAAAAMPEIPLHGIDLVRDIDTGEIFVLEVNPRGWTWHFSTKTGKHTQRENNIDFAAQFDGFRKAAEVLIRVTREHAR